jgi:hypothetical protein
LWQRGVKTVVRAARAEPQASVPMLLGARLGPEAGSWPVVADEWAEYDHVNVQAALDVWLADPARRWKLFGLTGVQPPEGITDVHRYLTAVVHGRRITLDVTFPERAWDGRASMPLACGPGRDYPAVSDPDADKRSLEVAHCHPSVRQPFITALASA